MDFHVNKWALQYTLKAQKASTSGIHACSITISEPVQKERLNASFMNASMILRCSTFASSY